MELHITGQCADLTPEWHAFDSGLLDLSGDTVVNR